jgi:oligosaccharide repeat unit polymerase
MASALVLVFLFGVTLPRVYRDTNLNQGGFVESFSQALDPTQLFDEFLLGQDTAMVDAFAIEIDKVPKSIPYQFGATYVEALARPVPKALFPGKPLSADQVLNAALFPESYERGLGVSFSIFGEPYLNGGLLGVVIVMALLGGASGLFWSWFNRRPTNIHAISIAALCIPYTFVFFRGGLGVDYHRLLIPLVPLLLVLAVGQRFNSAQGVAKLKPKAKPTLGVTRL